MLAGKRKREKSKRRVTDEMKGSRLIGCGHDQGRYAGDVKREVPKMELPDKRKGERPDRIIIMDEVREGIASGGVRKYA